MRALILSSLALLAAAPAMAQQRGYAGTVGSSWVEISLDMAACLRIANDSMAAAGFNVDAIGPNEQTVFGGLGGDVMIVRCIPNHRVAVIATHSPAGHNMMEGSRAVGMALRGDAAPPRAPTVPPVAPPAGGGGAKQ